MKVYQFNYKNKDEIPMIMNLHDRLLYSINIDDQARIVTINVRSAIEKYVILCSGVLHLDITSLKLWGGGSEVRIMGTAIEDGSLYIEGKEEGLAEELKKVNSMPYEYMYRKVLNEIFEFIIETVEGDQYKIICSDIVFVKIADIDEDIKPLY